VKILLLTLSLQSLSSPDRWLATDKLQHFLLGTFVQSASFGVLRAAKVGKSEAMIGASAVSITAAIGKELRDRRGGGDPRARDAHATLVGAGAISQLLLRTK
jgi:glutamyl-tRNA reductase